MHPVKAEFLIIGCLWPRVVPWERGLQGWAFARILPGEVVGRDCDICDHTFIENPVVVGDRVRIQCREYE